MQILSSIKDPLIVQARELNKATARTHACLLEGETIIQWALDANVEIQHVFVSDNYDNETFIQQLSVANIRCYQCSIGIMKKINEAKFLSPIIALATIPQPQSQENPPAFTLMLDNLQDQGNIGTIIRTASAFNIQNIITSGKSHDVFNKKTMTASRGTIFHIQHQRSSNSIDTIKQLKSHGYQIVATSPRGSQLQSLVKLPQKPLVLIVGNETHGLDDAVLQQADTVIQIPMNRSTESLNVGVASGITLYELKLKVLIAMLTKNIRATLGRELGVTHQLVRQTFDHQL